MDATSERKNMIVPADIGKKDKSLDEDDEPRVSLRIKVEKILSGNVGKTIDYVSTILSLGTFIMYLVRSYADNLQWFFWKIDIGIMIFFSIEYILKFYAAQHKYQYFFLNYETFIDLCTCIPVFIVFLETNLT